MRPAAVARCAWHARPGFSLRRPVGSVARDRAFQASHRPVLLVGPRMDVVGFDRPRSILLATDGSVTVRRDDAVSWLALRRSGCPSTSSPSTRLRASSSPEALSASGPSSNMSRSGVPTWRDSACTPRHTSFAASTRHLKSAPVASTLPSPLAVLAGHTSGIAGRLGLGSVSSTVVHAGPAPVLLVPRSRTGDDQAGTGGVGSA